MVFFVKFSRSLMRSKQLPGTKQARRWLNIHEYQAKKLMELYGVRVQKGKSAHNASQAAVIGSQLMADKKYSCVILKAQVLAGGRGKGRYEDGFKGGVHLVSEPEKIENIAEKMLNKRLITKQTGPSGEYVHQILVLGGVDFDKEMYVAILLDRKVCAPVIVASPMGGMDIEAVAEKTPEKIMKTVIDYSEGLTRSQAEKIATFIGIPRGPAFEDGIKVLFNLYEMFHKECAIQVEINPLVVTKDIKPKVVCLDAKLGFDGTLPKSLAKDKISETGGNNSHKPEVLSKEDERIAKAEAHGLSFIPLDGTIGCLVNGAGLAMATMDVITQKGGNPANFLDVGGGADESQVRAAFELIAEDKKVRGILVNIFGGILRCDVLARGIVSAAKAVDLKMPLVVRLEGTNVEDGKRILSESGLAIKTATSLDDAAEKAVLVTKTTQ